MQGIDFDVTQGSWLGPYRFLILINDLPKDTQNSAVPMFTDDASRCLLPTKATTKVNEAVYRDLDR